MEKNEEARKERQKKTPIIDGDARPDLNVLGDEKEPRDHPIETPRDREKQSATTKNRNDTNSLEDYKDAKME